MAQTYAEFLATKREWMQHSIYIYGLVDPRTEQIRYVGKSIRPRERRTNHCNDRSRTWRTNWLRELRAATGRRPYVTILEVLDRGADWQAAERRWIAHGKAQGWPLTNCTSGGDGVPDLPPQTRERIRQASIGRAPTSEQRERIGQASRGRHHTEEHKAKMRRLMTGRVVTWGDKLRQAVQKLTPEHVRAIRLQLSQRVPQRVIALAFGVHQGTIYNIKHGVCYQDVR